MTIARLLDIASTLDDAHHALCEVAEGMLPADAYFNGTASLIADGRATEPTEPAPLVVLPTVDEIADVLGSAYLAWSDNNDKASIHRAYAAAVLDLFAARVPHWVRIEPGTLVKAGTRMREVTKRGNVEEWTSKTEWTPRNGEFYVDPRTIPAEPVDPALAVVIECLEESEPETREADARRLLVLIDAARADK